MPVNSNTFPDISDHQRWQLQLTAGHNGVRANYFDVISPRAFVHTDQHWRCDPADALRKIEDTIYDNPDIVDDYTTCILVRPVQMVFLPADSLPPDADEEARELADLVDACENKDVWSEELLPGIRAVYTTPGGVRDFLTRTFPTEDVQLALRPMARHVAAWGADGAEKVWVHLDADTLDIIAMAGGKPVIINTREYHGAADAAYYVVSVVRTLGLSASRAEVRLSGEESVRRELLPMLRRHLGFVSNALLPAPVKQALSAGLSLSEALLTHKKKSQ